MKTIKSPCTGNCRMREEVCVGCHRTFKEVMMWINMSSKEKSAVLKRIKMSEHQFTDHQVAEIPDTADMKDKALAALKNRKEHQPPHINNASLYAGSPMYFYCKYCGHESDCLDESYTGSPRRICDECQDMRNSGWLA